MNKIRENLRHSKPFYLIIAVLYILLLVSYYYFSFHHPSFLPFAFFTFLICFLILFYTGGIRKNEIASVREIINSIQAKKIQSTEEITLSGNLKDLEDDIRKMFAQVKQDIEYLKKLEQVRTEFLGNVSHELRTPIFAIHGYLETLIDGAMYDEKVNRNFLLKANQHVQNLNNLLNDLIDISMIESGEMNLSFRYFAFGEFISEVVRDIKHLAEEKGLRLLTPDLKEDIQVLGDRNKLRQVFINLIQNAIKYTEKGTIEISIEKGPKSLKVTIKDTGIGISQEDIPRIFERFYRVNKDRSREAGGTGLGLAIVKHIIDAHESKIEVASQPGRGSSFSFVLKV